ncbi:MAG: hypothetical protein Q9167_004878 [Letrouitia subvulpina]
MNHSKSIFDLFDRRTRGSPFNALPSQNDMLCEPCSMILSAFFTKAGSPIKLYDSKAQLRASVEKGCPLCAILYARLESYAGWFVAEENAIEHAVDASGPVTVMWRRVQNVVGDSAGSEATIQLANNWLKYCVENHPRCPGRLGEGQMTKLERIGMGKESYDTLLTSDFFRLSSSNEHLFIPSRLIDVGPSDGAQCPKLCESRDIARSSARYITLSHCWDSQTEAILKTTTATLQERFEGIEMSQLPSNFKDPVVLTKKPGVHYLWIGSLCIIQDSAEDWNHEASMMGEIYSNSYCTLAASSSTSSNDGFLCRRNPKCSYPCVLTYPSSTGISEGIVVHPAFPLPTFEEIALKKVPLLKRAWTLQERDLSPRTLHFIDNQLMWECRSQKAMESDPQKALTKSLWAPMNGASHFFDAVNSGPSNHLIHWYAMVKDYPDRGLTFAIDKLSAISGMAKKMQELTRDVYVAGLWEGDLLRGLCWESQSKTVYDFSQMDRPYIAPSWSWAAVSCAVHWPYETLEYEPLKEEERTLILNVKVELAGSDSTGRISYGHLRIAGLARVLRKHDDPDGLMFEPAYYRESVRTYTIIEDPDFSFREIGTMLMDREFEIEDKEPVILLPVLQERARGSEERGNILALVLAVRPEAEDDMERQDKHGSAATEKAKERLLSGFGKRVRNITESLQQKVL